MSIKKTLQNKNKKRFTKEEYKYPKFKRIMQQE